jgi:hypothetical protein
MTSPRPAVCTNQPDPGAKYGRRFIQPTGLFYKTMQTWQMAVRACIYIARPYNWNERSSRKARTSLLKSRLKTPRATSTRRHRSLRDISSYSADIATGCHSGDVHNTSCRTIKNKYSAPDAAQLLRYPLAGKVLRVCLLANVGQSIDRSIPTWRVSPINHETAQRTWAV